MGGLKRTASRGSPAQVTAERAGGAVAAERAGGAVAAERAGAAVAAEPTGGLLVVDTVAPLTPAVVARLAAAGVAGVIKYAARTTRLSSKRWTAAEVQRCHQAGLATGLVVQETNSRLAGLSAALGAAQAAHGVAVARSLGAPAGTVLYFAADFDPGDLPLAPAGAYFAAVHPVVRAAGYRVGGYGAGRTLAGVAAWLDRRWLAGAAGWAGTRQALADATWDLCQSPPGPLAGIMVDRNRVAPGLDLAAIGLWGGISRLTDHRPQPPVIGTCGG